MQERWLPVVGWEGWYEVSDQGRVRRVAKARKAVPGRVMSGTPNRKRYISVTLSRHPRKESHQIHLLVATAFLGSRPGWAEECRHKDGSKTNNAVPNLAWCTRERNHFDRLIHDGGNRGRGRKLNQWRARQICHLAKRGNLSHQQIARFFGVARGTVRNIIYGCRHCWEWATEDIRCA